MVALASLITCSRIWVVVIDYVFASLFEAMPNIEAGT